MTQYASLLAQTVVNVIGQTSFHVPVLFMDAGPAITGQLLHDAGYTAACYEKDESFKNDWEIPEIMLDDLGEIESEAFFLSILENYENKKMITTMKRLSRKVGIVHRAFRREEHDKFLAEMLEQRLFLTQVMGYVNLFIFDKE